MRNDKRACFALIAATLINKRRYSRVYDYSAGKYINVSSSNVQSTYLSFFDFNRGGYVSGSSHSLYDYPTSSYVSIKIQGNRVSGYDYETGFYVDFSVRRNGVTAFDHQTSSDYKYGV